MYIGDLPIFDTAPEPQTDLTVSLPESLVEQIDQIADEFNIAVDKLIESALCFWLLCGHEDK